MIIEHDGICYDTNNPQQNAELKSKYKEVAEQYTRRHSGLGEHVVGLNQSIRDTNRRNEQALWGHTKTARSEASTPREGMHGGWLLILFFVGLPVAMYLLGLWSFGVCLPAGNGMQMCL